jgi:hypothetical protein
MAINMASALHLPLSLLFLHQNLLLPSKGLKVRRQGEFLTREAACASPTVAGQFPIRGAEP